MLPSSLIHAVPQLSILARKLDEGLWGIERDGILRGMKSILDPDTTPEQKMEQFQDGLRKVLNCSKTQLENALAYEKRMNAGKPKRGPKPSSASGRASKGKD